jgi:hypothetical protein
MTIPTRKATLLDSGGAYNGNITTQACNHPYLVVIVHSAYAYGAPVPSGVTFNGKAMAHIGDSIKDYRAVSFWGIVPDIGTYNLHVTIGTLDACQTVAVQYQNVAQTSSYAGYAATSATSANPDVTVSGNLNVIGIAAFSISGNRGITLGSGETLIAKNVVGGITYCSSDKPGAASIAFSDTSSAGDGWAMGGFVLNPAGSGLQTWIY